MSTQKPDTYSIHSEKKTSTNGDRCWMSIGVNVLQRAVYENQTYTFEFAIDEREHYFSIPARELKKALEDHGVHTTKSRGYEKYMLYADYRSGEVFASVSRKNRDVIIKLHEEGGKDDESQGG